MMLISISLANAPRRPSVWIVTKKPCLSHSLKHGYTTLSRLESEFR
jgi:hypothetical protein